MKLLKDQKERTRFFRFALVGILGAVIDFGLFNLLTVALKMEALPASTISFVAAVVNNYFLNRAWTYPESRSKPVLRQAGMFFVVSLVGLAIRALMFTLLENPLIELSAKVLPPNFLTPTIVGHNLTLALAILIVMLWNFTANRYWTYNDIS
ncbi:MAG TPA: GtrA family protein [Anaerolineaceae bacterium]|nr:GtrA family protein [Anaerolineaceae bacterium]